MSSNFHNNWEKQITEKRENNNNNKEEELKFSVYPINERFKFKLRQIDYLSNDFSYFVVTETFHHSVRITFFL